MCLSAASLLSVSLITRLIVLVQAIAVYMNCVLTVVGRGEGPLDPTTLLLQWVLGFLLWFLKDPSTLLTSPIAACSLNISTDTWSGSCLKSLSVWSGSGLVCSSPVCAALGHLKLFYGFTIERNVHVAVSSGVEEKGMCLDCFPGSCVVSTHRWRCSGDTHCRRVMLSSPPLYGPAESKGQPGSSSAVSCCCRHPWESPQNTYLGCSHTPCTTRYLPASQRLNINDPKWYFCCAMGRKQGVTDITSVLSPCSDREFSWYRRFLETSWTPSRRGDWYNWSVGDESTK